jgi:hypothetical protein
VSRWKRPLTARDVRQIAKNLGFTYRNTEGGHENWIRETPPPFRKMTIDAHIAPFAHTLISYMARQAGVSVREFYQALDK